MSELTPIPTGGDLRAIPHAFRESRSLFASERLLCGWCNRESYNPVHTEGADEAGHAGNGPSSAT